MSQCHDDYEAWADASGAAGEPPDGDSTDRPEQDPTVEGEQCHDVYEPPADGLVA